MYRSCFREAISVVCEAVPGAKGAQRRRKVHTSTHPYRALFIYTA